MSAEQIFIRSVQEKDHRRLRTLKNTEELKKEPKPVTGAFFEPVTQSLRCHLTIKFTVEISETKITFLDMGFFQ